MALFKKTSVSKDLINLVRARDNGEAWAMKKLAELCNDDTVTLRELGEARIAIYEAAAKRGDKEARYWMGLSLQEVDPPASFKWLIDLAREGHTKAMKTLGLGFSAVAYYGEDPEKELYWYLEAAKLGDADAQQRAGKEYYLKGLENDNNPQGQKYYEMAWEWFEKSANQNYVQGVLSLAELAMKHGDRCKDAVYRKYNYDFKNPAMQEELAEAKEQAQQDYQGAADLLIEIVDGKYEDCTNDEAAKAFDILGDMMRLNCFDAEPPPHEEAVHYYYLATLFDDGDNLISEKKMKDIISQQHLAISPRQFEDWKQEVFGE